MNSGFREKFIHMYSRLRASLLVYMTVFGPATIAAMADNDTTGVATYAIAGAQLGYPILFVLLITTILLGITQEMGVRLSLVSRKGLGDHIRENYGVKVSLFIFFCLFLANMGNIIVDVAAFKTTAEILRLPAVPIMVVMIVFTFFFVTKGDYKKTQNIMLVSSLFYLAYIFSAFKAQPDWGAALSNIFYPHGVRFTPDYIKTYIVVGLGVLGTTVTPWGQFLISSFSLDKKIDKEKLKFSQIETYWGAFLTDFFSFFMIVATAATLYVHHLPIESGEQAAMAIEPFAGKLAANLFAFGILNAGFMGIVTISLSTTYAFSEFFGYSGSLDASFKQSKAFYSLFLLQLVLAFLIVLLPFINLFQIVVAVQVFNAMVLPIVFFFLIKFTSQKQIMGEYVNTRFQKWSTIIGTIVIAAASLFALYTTFFKI